MANELKIKNGLLVVGNEQVTGSLTVSQGITSSLGAFTTASWAQNAVTSSYALNSAATTLFTASVYQITASWANNAVTATTATAATSASWASQSFNAATATASVSSSWASSSYSASFLTVGTYQITASWANNTALASNATSASWASQSFNAATATASISASWASSSYSSSFLTPGTYQVTSSYAITAATASSLTGFTFDNSSSLSVVTASNNTVVQRLTGSYLSVDYQYVINSGSNLRVGNIFGGWLPSGSTVTYAEYVTTDLGDTSQVSMSIFLTQSMVQLLSNAATSYSWSIRALATYL